MRKLLEQGWDPTVKDLSGWTPADYAKTCKDSELSNCQEVRQTLKELVKSNEVAVEK